MRMSPLSFMVLLLLNQAASADAILWSGGSGNWSDPTHWNPNAVPDNGATRYQVTVNSGGADTVNLDLSPKVDSLLVGASSGTNTSTLSITGQTLTLGDATVAPVLRVNAKGIVNVGAGSSLAVDLRAGNSITNPNTGAINLNGGSLALTGGTSNAFTLTGTGATTLNGGTIKGSGAEALTIAGPVSGSGTIADLTSFKTQGSITVGSGKSLAVNNVGSLILDGSSNSLTVNGGVVTTSGSVLVNNASAGLNLSNGGTVSIGGALNLSAASYFGNGATLQGAGTSLSAKGGTFAGPFNIGTGGSVDLRGGAWTAYNSGTNTLNNKSLTLGGNLYFDGGPVYTANSSITLQGGGLYYGAGAGTDALANLSSVNGSLTVKNAMTQTITPNGGTFTGTVNVGTSGQTDTSSLSLNGAFGTGTSYSVNAYAGTQFSAQGGSLASALVAQGASINLRGGTLGNYNAGTQTLSGLSSSTALFNVTGGSLQYDGGPVQTIADTAWVSLGSSGGVNGSITAYNGGVGSDPFANLNTIQGRLSISNPTYTINPTVGTLTMQKVSGDPIFDVGSQTGGQPSVVTINGALVDNGRLRIGSGSSLYTLGFTNNSSPTTGTNVGVNIGIGALLDARGGAFGSLDGAGTLGVGSYYVNANGQLLYDGGDIKTLNGKITLDGSGATIKHGAGAGTDAFGALTTVSGSLLLNTGVAHTFTPDGGTLTLNGQTNGTGFIGIGTSNTAAPGTAITVNGNMQLNDQSNIAVEVATKDSSFIVNGNVTGSGGINIIGQNALFKLTGDYTQTAGTFSTTSSANGPKAFEIGGNVTKSGNMNISSQTLNVGGGLSNLAGSFSVGNASNGSSRGTVNIGGNLVNNSSFSVNASSFFGSPASPPLGGIVNVTLDALNTKTITIGGNSATSRSAELHVGGNFNNTATATLTGNNQTVALAGGNPAVLTVGGNFTNAGTVNLGTNNIATITGTYTQTAGKTRIGAGGTISASEFLLRGGSMGGAGTYIGDVHVTGGTFAPGDPTTTSITGDYDQSGGVLSLVIGSTISYDQLHISHDANITGGTLKITYLPGYVPHFGDFFQFITVGGLFTGDWSGFDFQGLGGDLHWEAAIINGGFALRVVPEPASWTLLVAGIVFSRRFLAKAKRKL
jgi:hypothetical protein